MKELVAGQNIELTMNQAGNVVVSSLAQAGSLPAYSDWTVTAEQNQQAAIDVSNGAPTQDINDNQLTFSLSIPDGSGVWVPAAAGSNNGVLIMSAIGPFAIPVTVTDGVVSASYVLTVNVVNTVPNIPNAALLATENEALIHTLGPAVDHNGDSVAYTFQANGTQSFSTATTTATITGNVLSYTSTTAGHEDVVIRADDGYNTKDFTLTLATITASSDAVVRNFHTTKLVNRQWPTALGATSSESITSAPVTVSNLEADYIDIIACNNLDARFSVNGGSWLDPLVDQVRFVNGDVIQIRGDALTGRNTKKIFTIACAPGPNAVANYNQSMYWEILTAYNDRGSVVDWKIGASGADGTQLVDILAQVQPGDTIEIITAGYELDSVDIDRVVGTGSARIKLYSNFTGDQRPSFTAGGNSLYSEHGIAFRLRDSHFWDVENVIIDGLQDSGVNKVVAYQAANCRFKNCLIQNSNHTTGFQGWDVGSGSVEFEFCEFQNCGGNGQAFAHGVYGSSDYDQFPSAAYYFKFCLLSKNEVNTIKSRSANLVLDRCWIDNIDAETDESLTNFLVQHIGPESYYFDIFSPGETIISGCVLWHKYKHSHVQFGNDGSGIANNKVLMQNNLCVFSADSAEYDSYTSLDNNYNIASIYFRNNIFCIEGGTRTSGNDYLTLVRAGTANWYYGYSRVRGNNNLGLGDTNVSFNLRTDSLYPPMQSSPVVDSWTNDHFATAADVSFTANRTTKGLVFGGSPTDDVISTGFLNETALPTGYEMPNTYEKFSALTDPNTYDTVLVQTRPATNTHLPDTLVTTRAAGGKLGPF